MVSRIPQLDGDMPPVPRREWAEQVHEVAAGSLQKLHQAVRPIPLEQQPGVGVDKIRRRQGLLPDHRRGEAPYDVEYSIILGREVTLLDSKLLEAMPAGEGETVVVRVRGGELRVKSLKEGWWARWKHWTNMHKQYIINVRVNLFWSRHPQDHGYAVGMYDVMTRIRDGVLYVHR